MFLKAIILSAGLTATAAAQVTSVNLSNYTLTQTINLPTPSLTETSANPYNWDNGHLYAMGDNGTFIVEMSLLGVPISSMSLSGFEDTEGLTYLGGSQFVIAEERLQRLYRFTYIPGGTLVRSSLQNAALGATVGNEGIEGVCFEPLTGLYFAVKEKTPARILRATVNFPAGTATVTDLFDPALLGILDLSDIAVLSTVPSLVGTPDQDNLLIISQASARLVKATRTGQVLGFIDFTGLSTTAEGVSIDSQGTIYITDETPKLFIFKPHPCSPNCDASTTPPVLTANDFQCFLNAFASGVSTANCDNSTTPPVLTANDFQCFLNAFAAGCT